MSGINNKQTNRVLERSLQIIEQNTAVMKEMLHVAEVGTGRMIGQDKTGRHEAEVRVITAERLVISSRNVLGFRETTDDW